MFWLRILVPSAVMTNGRGEPGQGRPLVLVIVDRDDLGVGARVELLDLALEPQGRRRRVELVGDRDFGQRHLDPEDLGGHAEQVAAGLRVRGRDVHLEVVDQDDKEAAGVGAELGRFLRSEDSQRGHARVFGLDGVLHGLEVVGVVDVHPDGDRVLRRGARRYGLRDDHEVLCKLHLELPPVPAGRAGQERAEMEIGRDARVGSRREPSGQGRVGAALVRGIAPLEQAADVDRLGPRLQRQVARSGNH